MASSSPILPDHGKIPKPVARPAALFLARENRLPGNLSVPSRTAPISLRCGTVCRREGCALEPSRHGGKPCELHISADPRATILAAPARLPALEQPAGMVYPSRWKPWHTGKTTADIGPVMPRHEDGR